MKKNISTKLISLILTTSILSSCSSMPSPRQVAKVAGGAVMLGSLTKFKTDDSRTEEEKDDDQKQGLGILAAGALIYYLAGIGEEKKTSSSSSSKAPTSMKKQPFGGQSRDRVGGKRAYNAYMKRKAEAAAVKIPKYAQKSGAPSQDFATAKKEEVLLQVLNSTPTPNVTGTHAMTEDEASCNKGARKAYILSVFCQTKQRIGNAASASLAIPKGVCEEAEKGRKFASTTLGKEVVRIESIRGVSNHSMVSPKEIPNIIRKSEALPKDCE